MHKVVQRLVLVLSVQLNPKINPSISETHSRQTKLFPIGDARLVHCKKGNDTFENLRLNAEFQALMCMSITLSHFT